MRVRLLLAIAVVATACGGSDGPTNTLPPVTAKTWDVVTLSTAFSPNFLTITAGDTVRYTITKSANGEGHDVTFDAKAGAPANIPVTLTGTFTRVFATRGTFHYNCFVHPGMNGDVTVQ